MSSKLSDFRDQVVETERSNYYISTRAREMVTIEWHGTTLQFKTLVFHLETEELMGGTLTSATNVRIGINDYTITEIEFFLGSDLCPESVELSYPVSAVVGGRFLEFENIKTTSGLSFHTNGTVMSGKLVHPTIFEIGNNSYEFISIGFFDDGRVSGGMPVSNTIAAEDGEKLVISGEPQDCFFGYSVSFSPDEKIDWADLSSGERYERQPRPQRREIAGIAELIGNLAEGGVKTELNNLYERFQTVENFEHAAAPGEFAMSIRDIREKAYQRAFLNEVCSIQLNDQELCPIEWVDIEVPVVFNADARRPSVDLVGIYQDRATLGELKFATAESHSNSPELALLEILIYIHFTRENIELLSAGQIQHANSRQDIPWADFDFQTPTLMIIGNEQYWNYWLNRPTYYINGQPNMENYNNHIRSIAESNEVNIIKLSGPDIDFETQRGDHEQYEPSNGGDSIVLEEIM